ncbi:MAG: SpoIID/LytB domain-containing protein, partial [Candidatus Firestonebacteria bacterium]|nr:SpoIID/LytB domain-containing protein [Candidatus Firestonebacteria bacterium]
KDALLSFQDRKFRGNFIVDIDGNYILLINHCDLEKYLYGVIRNEVSPDWPNEAIKAQIIAARTYALFKKNYNKNNKYYLEATTHFQIYRGYEKEDSTINNLIDSTRGIILIYNNKPIEAIYHSSCGGFTENAQDVWGKELEYLKGVYTDYCRSSKAFNWNKFISYEKISRMLSNKIKMSSSVNYVKIGKTSNSRRVLTLIFSTSNGKTYEIPGKDFRLWFGNKDIPSTLFTIRNEKTGIFLEGRGFGHGVGLCQMCAKEMAKRGSKYSEILHYFYRNISLNIY